MADTPDQTNLRGIQVEKAVKGFALVNYMFKTDVTTASASADSIRWYQETATDMTATAPAVNANLGRLSTFPYLEHSWTRNTTYPRKYGAETFVSLEDIKTADIDVLGRMLLRLTRSAVKQVDSRIWDVLTESRTVVNINSVTSTAAWDAGSGQDPVEDVLEALMDIEQNNYDTSQAVLYLSPKDKKSLITWIISTKGSSIPAFSSQRVVDGTIMEFVGCRVKVSNNVTADYALVVGNPKQACTWYSVQDTTANLIEDPGLGTKIRVFEIGEAVLTDPKLCSLISNTQT